ncbi:hypothetical protein KIN20_001834 [Parelaphostrongylus tenuis]|uniref:Uncharacterized protein n=1 Tax=Parelaphostrongylus tenuis TaxID=148309 RepID=A0AAD5LYY9_PARTN|nr:hypothetical protein KIN20_001834 [Parelaphostrongylus tenuis]
MGGLGSQCQHSARNRYASTTTEYVTMRCGRLMSAVAKGGTEIASHWPLPFRMMWVRKPVPSVQHLNRRGTRWWTGSTGPITDKYSRSFKSTTMACISKPRRDTDPTKLLQVRSGGECTPFERKRQHRCKRNNSWWEYD